MKQAIGFPKEGSESRIIDPTSQFDPVSNGARPNRRRERSRQMGIDFAGEVVKSDNPAFAPGDSSKT